MKKLIKFAESINIAEDLTSGKLAEIASRIVEQFNSDFNSMSDWRELNDKGCELSKPTLQPRTAPWQGAANYKSTAIMQAVNSFGDRASAELLRDKELFMTDVIGKDDEKESKRMIADRIQEFENFQINYRMDDFRDNQSDMLYNLARYGCLFKRVYFDPLENRKVSCVIEYPNYVVSMGIKSLEKARSFTEIVAYSLNEAKEFQSLGYWLDVDLTKGEDMQQGSNESEDAKNASENTDCYYIQNTFLDLDDDGYEEPYCVTYHKGSDSIVRIVADYTLSDIMIRNGGKIISVGDAKKLGELAFNAVLQSAELMKVNRKMELVKYGFIRGDGFLDIGYYYLLAAFTQLVNTTTNMLLDAGAMSNQQSGFLAKEFRKNPNQSGATAFKPGEWKQTDIPAANLANGILPLPIKEPSGILFQLNELAKAELANFSASVDLSALVANNVAPTTAMVSVNEQLVPISAIYQYIQRSQSKEFEKLMALTPLHFTDAEYQEVLGEQASIENDYSSMVTIRATAQKQMSSDITRMFEAQALQQMMPNITAVGGNGVKIMRLALEQFKSVKADDILPEMDEAKEAEANAKMAASQAKQEQLLDLQIASANAEAEGFRAQQQAYQIKQQAEMAKIEGDIRLNEANIEKIKAQTIKEWEDAQAQAIKNDMINIGIKKAIDNQLSGAVSQPEMEEDGKPEMMRERKMEHKEEMMKEKGEEMEDDKEESKEEKPMIAIEIKPEE